jgi:hypothetical protein
MKVPYRIARTCWALVIALIGTSLSFSQATEGHDSLTLPADKSTIVRFFYLPAEDYLHPALIFRVAREKDPQLNTAPINRLGRTPYISLAEMQDLLQRLAHSGLSWHESRRVEVPGRIEPREMTDKVEIKIFSSEGTALTLSDPKKLCETLAPLDAALKQPRALWEFQLFRVDYNCVVPGFDRNAFPEHEEGMR